MVLEIARKISTDGNCSKLVGYKRNNNLLRDIPCKRAFPLLHPSHLQIRKRCLKMLTMDQLTLHLVFHTKFGGSSSHSVLSRHLMCHYTIFFD